MSTTEDDSERHGANILAESDEDQPLLTHPSSQQHLDDVDNKENETAILANVWRAAPALLLGWLH